MRSRRFAIVVGTLIVVTGLYTGAVRAGDVPRMGDQRVGVYACAFLGGCDPMTLEANVAFHVAHGYGSESWEDLVNPVTRFELTVDEVQVHGAIDLSKGDPLSSKTYVFNFPRGMAGTHSFEGCWYLPDGSLHACGTRIVYFT